MRFGIFYEHQNPRPWTGERSEHTLLHNALAQVELADRVGFDYVWEVEHHFLEEYSHSSAPEVFLAAAAARTKRIRLGHGIVQLPPGVNHPARVAERAATLDLISDGRLEFGTGESSSEAELGGFLVDRAQKRAHVGGRDRRDHADVRGGAVRRAGTASSSACRRATSFRSPCSGRTRRCGWRAAAARRSSSPPATGSGRSRSRSWSRRTPVSGSASTTSCSTPRSACRRASRSTRTSPSSCR